MNVSINGQTLIFLYAILVGQCVGIVYDLFRSVRITFKFKTFYTFICDSMFWLVSLFLFFVFILNFAGGEGRFYIIFAMILGIFLYFLCVSYIFLAVFKKFIWFAYYLINKILIFLFDNLKKISQILKKHF